MQITPILHTMPPAQRLRKRLSYQLLCQTCFEPVTVPPHVIRVKKCAGCEERVDGRG